MSESVTDTETDAEKIARLTTQLADARSEAAKNRVAKRTAVEDAKLALEAELKADHEAALAKVTAAQTTATNDLASAQTQVARLQAAMASVFDGPVVERVVDIANRLVGTNQDELKADAERVKTLYGLAAPAARTPAVDPSQGSGAASAELPLNGDPLLGMVNAIVNKGNRR